MSKILTPGHGSIAARLRELAVDLPQPTVSPLANIEGFVLAGNWLYVSGQIPQWAGEYRYIGKVGDTFGEAEGYQAARLCAINVLSCAHVALEGNLDRLGKLVKVTGYVNATPDLTNVHRVVNGASDFFIDVLGERGRHARTAVGATVMPFGVAVEIEAVFFVNDR
jgi:enamine deaminase RidA (YjgF/YER057c/UK114 family)